MADNLTPEQRRLNMSRIRGKDTKPELALRKALHERGFRYLLNRKTLPGSPDLALPKYRSAVFVHGCFWHGHNCHRCKVPRTRTSFWIEKIERNKRRDQAVEQELTRLGWRVVIVWECSLVGRTSLGIKNVADECATFLRSTQLQALVIPGMDASTE